MSPVDCLGSLGAERSTRRVCGWFPTLLAALFVPGCGGSPTAPSGGGAGEGPKPADSAKLPELTGEVTLEPANWEEFQEKVAAHKGKVVVVDVWSSWCPPCVKEFPGLVKLQRRHPKDAVCMSLNLNYDGSKGGPTDELKSEVLEFLKQHDAKFPNYYSTVADETLFTTADLTLPAILVYGPDGALAQKFVEDPAKYGAGGFTYEKHVEPLVKSLIESGKP